MSQPRTTPFRLGQHVLCGRSAIVEICGHRSPNYGGCYTVRQLFPAPVAAVDRYAQSARTQEYLLAEIAEADLCRLPRHTCGKVHVPTGYQINPGIGATS